MEQRVIGVTGATGAVGGRVAARLAAQGATQRLIVRDPARAPHFPSAEVRGATGYGAAAEMRAAFAGVDTLFLIPATEAADRLQQHQTTVDAAVAAGVRHLIYLSFLGAAPEATFTFARDHWHTEEHIRRAGIPFTFLRMSFYLDFIPSLVLPNGLIKGPAGNGHLAPILRDDVADVAAAVLLSGGHAGQSYAITGRERFTLTKAAAQLARLSGKAIRFEDETIEEAFASRAGYGAPAFEVAGWVSTYTAIASGELDVISDDVQRLAGHEPGTLAKFVAAHPDSLAHVNGA